MKQNWFTKAIKVATFEPAHWKQHIDVYFERMLEANFELPTIFDMWLDQVPAVLKHNDKLTPQFAQQVKEHLMQKYQFDPFARQEPAQDQAQLISDPRLVLLDRLLDEYQYFNTSPHIVINHWMARLSPEDRQDRHLLTQARRLLVEKHNIDPLDAEGHKPVFSSLPPIITLHLDMFFEQTMRDSPELQRPEFETGETYAATEGLDEIYHRWLNQLSPRMKEGDDIRPEFKQPLREYLIARWHFDPYPDAEETTPEAPEAIDDIHIPTPEELNDDWDSPPREPHAM